MQRIQAAGLWTLIQPSCRTPVAVNCDKISPRLKERFEGIQGDIYFESGTWSQHVLNEYSIAVTCTAISLRKVTDHKSVSQNLAELLPSEKYDHIERVMDNILTVYNELDEYTDIG